MQATHWVNVDGQPVAIPMNFLHYNCFIVLKIRVETLDNESLSSGIFSVR
jgi:hypothetical protein